MSRRRRRASLNTRLNDAQTPVFMLDHRRQVVFFNSGCEQLTGWTADELIGRICEYVTEPPPDPLEDRPAAAVGRDRSSGNAASEPVSLLIGSLCPPPEVLAGLPQTVPAYLPHRDGRSLGRQIHFFPLSDREGRVESILGLITPLDQPRPRTEPTPAQRLHAELASLRLMLRQRFSLSSVIAADPAMQRVLVQVKLASSTRVPIAITGEPGTGKEHLARVIHYTSAARSRAFVPLDCRQTPAIDLKLALRRLLDGEGRHGGRSRDDQPWGEPDRALSEGREAGGSPARGPAAAAYLLPGLRTGTLYLANVEFLPRDVQELVVQTFAGSRDTGDSRRAATAGDMGAMAPASGRPATAAADAESGESAVRLIVSTTADLDALVADETLRTDFHDLVTPLRIDVPPLRRRPDDLRHLAQSLLESHNHSSEIQIGGFAESVWSQFREYNWPGNIDELAAVVSEARNAAAEAIGRQADAGERPPALIGVEHLPFRFRTGLDAQSLGPRAEPRVRALEPYLEQIEREQILAALEQAKFSKKRAADLLGMTRPRLYRRMEALGIADREDSGDNDGSRTDGG